MALPAPQTVSQLQGAFVNAWAASLNPAFGVVAGNIPPGDPVLALAFATAGIGTYLQAQIQGLINYSRASTATGADLDSWLADFGPGAGRPPGGAAEGWISIPTSTGQDPAAPNTIPLGTVFQTDPIVIAPSTVPTVYYFMTTAQVTIPTDASFALAPYQASAPGAVYNSIPAGTPLNFSTGLVGVGNPTFSLAPGQSLGSAAPAGGSNTDSDPAARAHFVEFIDSLAGSSGSALVAGIESVSSYLVDGSTFVVWDYATQPTGGDQIAWPGQAVCVFVSPNPSYSGQYTGPTGIDPIADAILQAMNGTLQDPTEGVAFTITPLLYYALEYQITALTIGTIWVSQGAMAAAGLTLSQLKSNLQGALQTLLGLPNAPGLGIGLGIAWSAISQALLNYGGGGIVTDVALNSMTGAVTPPSDSPISYASATDGGMVPNHAHQSIVEGTGDPGGVLRYGSALNIVLTTINLVP